MEIIKKMKWFVLCALVMLIPSGDLIAKQGHSSHKSHRESNSHKKHSSHNKKNSSSHKKKSQKQSNKKTSPKSNHKTQKKNNTPKKASPASQTKKPASNAKRPNVNQGNYENYWHKSTFPTNQASITYHTNKHANGRSSLKYTQDAVNFYENNKNLRKPMQLNDGTPGYRINKGSEGGVWTQSGQVVTFWG